MIIREANSNDIDGIAKVHVDSWRTTYKNIVADDFLNNLSYENRRKLWSNQFSNSKNYIFVAVNEQEEIVGFICGQKEQSGKYPGYEGDVTSIYLDEKYQANGLGRKLLKELFIKFDSVNINSVIVWVLENNQSRVFYEKMGAKLVVNNESIKIGKEYLKLIGYGWENIKNILKMEAVDI
ncbi:GNAT family N-acetyltransferase [Bacillus sp. EAC]|uniref:GNAT family N-acetyltransferase n=1 Tax=Bacillus sp. EAC TaxID=1978338 RepID=UPI000B450182|nr:GNAT family N-acetyltransferase [Bacillus sp. EAC]